MKGIYFEEKGIELLGKLGVKKTEFARRMRIQRQNVNALFRTNNLEIIARAAEALDVPVGDSTEDVEARRVFQHWQFCNWMRY